MKRWKINKQSHKNLYKYCFFCGETDYCTLECHRIIHGKDSGAYNFENVLVLCGNCHSRVHSSEIVIDRKYKQLGSPVYKVHYWINGEEFWKDEEIQPFQT